MKVVPSGANAQSIIDNGGEGLAQTVRLIVVEKHLEMTKRMVCTSTTAVEGRRGRVATILQDCRQLEVLAREPLYDYFLDLCLSRRSRLRLDVTAKYRRQPSPLSQVTIQRVHLSYQQILQCWCLRLLLLADHSMASETMA